MVALPDVKQSWEANPFRLGRSFEISGSCHASSDHKNNKSGGSARPGHAAVVERRPCTSWFREDFGVSD